MAKKAYIGVPNYEIVAEAIMMPQGDGYWYVDSGWPDFEGNSLIGNIELAYYDESEDVVDWSESFFIPDVYFENDSYGYGSWFAGDENYQMDGSYGYLQFNDSGLGLDPGSPYLIRVSTGSHDGVARKVKKGYIGVLDKVVRFDGDMHYDADGDYWVSGSIAYVGSREMFDAAHVEFDGVLYKDLYVETMISNAKTFKYVYIPDTDINIEFNSDGDCELYDPSWELDTGRTYSLKIYTGNLESVARKIKKAYIGIGGVARPCWSGGELAYYGTIAGLKTAVMAHSATGNGTHAIFAGGTPSGATATAYDASLTQTFPSYFDSMYLSSASAAGYSIFGFGVTSSGSELTTAQRYDSSLTLTSHSGRQKRKVSGATSIGEFVIFAGGGYGNAATTQTVEVFHAPSMTNGTLSNLNYPSYRMGATSVGDYAIFAGGADAQVNASYVAYVVAYDLSTTKTNLADLSAAKATLGAATVGDYALFAGGNTKSSSSNSVDAYNKSLTRTSAPTLSAAWSDMGATTIGDYAVFAGGSVSGSGRTAKAECYDASLTRTSLPSLSVSRYDVKAATIGNYALFGGGSNGNYQSVVDAYTIA